MALYRFTATVNGERRACTFGYPTDWGTPDAEEAELFIMNDETTYREFYRGADEDDYNAELEDVKLERIEE